MVKRVRKFVAFSAVASLLLVLSALLWLQSGAQRIAGLEALIGRELSPAGMPYAMQVGQAEVEWHNIRQMGRIVLERVTLTSATGEAVMVVPMLEVTISPWRLLLGDLQVRSIRGAGIRLLLSRDAQGEIGLGFDTSQPSIPLHMLAQALSGKENASVTLPDVESVELYDVHVEVNDALSSETLFTDKARITYVNTADAPSFSLTFPYRYGKREGAVDARVTRTDAGMRLHANFSNLSLAMLCKFVECPEINEIRGATDSVITVQLDKNLTPDWAQGEIYLRNARITAPGWFETPLHIREGQLRARATNQWRNIELQRVSLETPDTTIALQASIEQAREGWGVAGSGSATRMDVTKLRHYWPLPLAPQTRTWVVDAMKQGFASANITLAAKPGDFALEHLPDHALRSEITVDGLFVDYAPPFPVAQNAAGKVYFTGETMRAEIESASALKGTKLYQTEVRMDDLYHPNVPAKIITKISAPAADAATILALEHFAFDNDFALDPAIIQGSVEGEMTLAFDAFTGKVADGKLNLDGIAYDIRAKLAGIAQKNIRGSTDISGLNGTLSVSNDALSFLGDMQFSGKPISIAAESESGASVRVSAKGIVAKRDFSLFGLPEIAWITDGTVAVDTTLALSKDAYMLETLKLNLADAALAVPEVSYTKPRAVPAMLTLQRPAKSTEYVLRVDAKDMLARGTLRLDSQMGLSQLTLDRVKNSENDFSLTYVKTAEGFAATLQGARLDARDAYASTENSLLADFPAMDLTLNLEALVLADASVLSNLRGTLRCDKARCTQADIRGEAAEKPFRGRIYDESGARHFNLTADNAGTFLKALDITDRVFQGSLEMKGTYADVGTQAGSLRANLLITNFTLKNSQVLGRILSIGSLSGLSNMLTGSGIDYQKLTAEIDAFKGIIGVKNGRAKGNAMGITVEGTVDTTSSSLNLKGVLVPAFIINSIVNNIPIIGELAGGEGEGLVAFNYSISGKYADPQASVNPLSGLTPGFLRGIFGVFDAPVEKTKSPSPQPSPSVREREGPAQAGG